MTEADGCKAAKISSSDAGERAVTSDVICQTFGYRSTVNSSGTSTLPTSAIRPRSFRTMSTIITFSARCLADACSVAPAAVLRQRPAAPGRALHRPRPDSQAIELEEQLRGRRADRPVAEVDERRVAAALGLDEVGEEGARSPSNAPSILKVKLT